MRGQVDPQSGMFVYFSPESRVPADHPLRTIKAHADAVLRSMNADFERLYSSTGRPSIPPERLLKASLLIALYTVRSDRMFCEMLDYNILFRWFLDMSLEDRGLDQSAFSRLRTRLVKEDTARRFFDAVVREAQARQLLSEEHFTVDGPLIEAWASTAKSVHPQDGPPVGGGRDDQGMVDFRGTKRSYATHESQTDSEATGCWAAKTTRRRQRRVAIRVPDDRQRTVLAKSWGCGACGWFERLRQDSGRRTSWVHHCPSPARSPQAVTAHRYDEMSYRRPPVDCVDAGGAYRVG